MSCGLETLDRLCVRSNIFSNKMHPIWYTTADPFVAAESYPGADLVVKAGVPVDADDHVDDQLEDAEDVRVVGAWVGAIEELEHPTDTKHAIDADEREVNAKVQVEQVGKCSQV